MKKVQSRLTAALTLMIAAAVVFAGCDKKSDDNEKPGTVGTFTDPRDGKTYKTVVMPDGRTWFAENLRYIKDLVWNQRADMANGVTFTSSVNGVPAIGSYWCPTRHGATTTPDQSSLDIYGALYTWETALMVDGKWADETKTSSTWNEAWVSGNNPDGDIPENTNVARGGRGICPPGWHIPTAAEWRNLGRALNDDSDRELKSASTYSGDDPGDGSWDYDYYVSRDGRNAPCLGQNATGFSVVPSGYRNQTGIYAWRGMYAMYLTSTPNQWGGSLRRDISGWCGGNTVLVSAGRNSIAYPYRCVMD